MCLISFAWKMSAQYKLLLAANRDEFINRPTRHARFDGDILAGKDLQAGGTWLGVTRTGRLAAVTNYRSADSLIEGAKTRGALVSEFLSSDCSVADYLLQLGDRGENYNPYNLLLYDGCELICYNSKTNQAETLSAGVYALSNHFLSSDWPKQNRTRAAMTKLLEEKKSIDADKLFSIMMNTERAIDSDLPETGVTLEWERRLSSIFIEGTDYATRSTSVVMFDYHGACQFIEKNHSQQGVSEIACDELFILTDNEQSLYS